jgi:hypothetical protein
VAQKGWDAGCREHCVWGYFADHYRPPERARNKQIADIAPTAIDARMIVRLESWSSGLIAWLLDNWFGRFDGDKIFIVVTIEAHFVAEIFVNFSVDVMKDDFFNFFFGECDFHDAP